MKNKWIIAIFICASLFISCTKDLLFPINKNELVGVWAAWGASYATDICRGQIYEMGYPVYIFKPDGTFTTSRGLEIDTMQEKRAKGISMTGKWEIQSSGDYNMKFIFNDKEVYWNINIDRYHKDRMNVFEKDCEHFGANFLKQE